MRNPLLRRRGALLLFVVVTACGVPPPDDNSCNANADCPSERPICFDAPGGQCIECISDSDCESGNCDEITPEGEGTGNCQE